jgi:hypothetical protein
MVDPEDIIKEGLKIMATETVKIAITPVIKDRIELIRNWFGKPWSEQRLTRAARILVDAEGQAIDAGFKPQPVHIRIVEPLLASASLEDDPELIRRWASLLSNASSPRASNKILPGYIDVLRQLTPIQVAILDWLYERRRARDEITTKEQLMEKFELPIDDFALFMTDFQRLNILRASNIQFQDAFSNQDIFRQVHLTTFGFYFIYSCQPPASNTDAEPQSD